MVCVQWCLRALQRARVAEGAAAAAARCDVDNIPRRIRGKVGAAAADTRVMEGSSALCAVAVSHHHHHIITHSAHHHIITPLYHHTVAVHPHYYTNTARRVVRMVSWEVGALKLLVLCWWCVKKICRDFT